MDKTRTCKKCGIELPLTEQFFYKKKNGKFWWTCKECNKNKCKEYYKANKEKLLSDAKKYRDDHVEYRREYQKKYYGKNKGTEEYKEKVKQYYQRSVELKRERKEERCNKFKVPCQKCGDERLYLIQFHHIDPSSKSFNLGAKMPDLCEEKLEEEAKKCICLCSNCHDEFHHFYGKNPKDPVKSIKNYLKGELYANC